MAAIILPFVTTYDDKGAKQAKTSLTGLIKSYGGVSTATALLGTAFKTSVTEASKLQETVSKNKVIFGDSADAIRDFASTASEKLGQSEQQALEAASTFAAFGKSAGLAGEQLVTFSTDLVTLSSDLASFANTSPEEAITAIGAALRGESEPIRKYNVLLNDLTLKQRAAKLGIYDGVGALTQQEKVLAAQAEILAQTGDAMGDFARTQEGLANGTRILTARLKDLAADAGGQVLPFLEDLITVTNSLIDQTDKNKGSFGSFVTVFGKVVDDLIPAIKVFQLISDVTGKWADNIRGTEKQLNQTAGKFREFEERQMARYIASKNEDISLTNKSAEASKKAENAAKKYADTLRDRVKTALESVNDEVKTAQTNFDNYAQTLTDIIKGSVSLGDAFQTQQDAEKQLTDALKDRADAYASLNKLNPTEEAEAYADALERVRDAEKGVTAAQKLRAETDYTKVFQDKIAASQRFAEKIQWLIQNQGLQQAGVAELLNLGPEVGNIVAGNMIDGVGGFTSAVLNEQLANLATSAGNLGMAGANAFFGAALTGATGRQGQVNQYSITVNAGLVSNPAQVGRDIIEAIKQAERVSGVVFQPA